MSRPLRVEFPGAAYHVMAHGNGSKWLYKDKEDLEGFKEVLAAVVRKFGFIIHCANLMQTHYHLLLETPFGNLSKGMMMLNREFAMLHNRKENRKGSVFQKRYKAILIEKGSYFETVRAYIYNNPVKAGYTDDPRAYEGSSLNWILSNDFWANRIISSKEIDNILKSDLTAIITEIRQIAIKLKSEEYEKLLIFGNKLWTEEIKARIDKTKVNPEIIQRKYWLEHPINLKHARKLLKKHRSLKVEDGLMYLLYQNTQTSLMDLAHRFYIKSANAVAQRLLRFRHELRHDAELNTAMSEFCG